MLQECDLYGSVKKKVHMRAYTYTRTHIMVRARERKTKRRKIAKTLNKERGKI